MTASAIYVGHVAHMRPGKHGLRYKVMMLATELGELPDLKRKLKCFSHNRFNLFSLFDSDHATGRREALRPQIEAKLHDADIHFGSGRIVLLAVPRVLNYVFNPLSVYFCYDQQETLAALVYEVSNTFGERHFYVMRAVQGRAGQAVGACDKEFFVSPFLEMQLRYEFTITPPGDKCAIGMIVQRGDTIALTASFMGKRQPLTDANLLRAFAVDPLMTFKIIAGIHLEALKMWLKGVRYLGRPVSVPSAANKNGAHSR